MQAQTGKLLLNKKERKTHRYCCDTKLCKHKNASKVERTKFLYHGGKKVKRFREPRSLGGL